MVHSEARCGARHRERTHIRTKQNDFRSDTSKLGDSSFSSSSSRLSAATEAQWAKLRTDQGSFGNPPTEGTESIDFKNYIEGNISGIQWSSKAAKHKFVKEQARNSKIYESFKNEVCGGGEWTEGAMRTWREGKSKSSQVDETKQEYTEDTENAKDASMTPSA